MPAGGNSFHSTFGLTTPPDIRIESDQITAVVLVYNEILRLPAFLEHYRKLGISNFVFVDNSSADGTLELLQAQPDVDVICTAKPFKSYKSIGRELIADTFLQGHWTIFPDADELLVYPGWPELDLPEFIQYLEAHKFEALFTTMVDMYAEGGLSELNYEPGMDLINTCPYFDPIGYRFSPLKGSHGKKFATPTRHIFGGTRERVFHTDAKRPKNAFDEVIIRKIFPIGSKAPETALRRRIDQLALKLVKNALPDPAAVQSKVQFLKWRQGLKFSGSVHNVRQKLRLAPDWGALLHFKYLNDYAKKISEALERKQHTDNSGHYLDYRNHLKRLQKNGLVFEKSMRFESCQSLIDCGLMRESELLKSWRQKASKFSQV